MVVDNADLADDHSLAVLAQLADARRIRVLLAAESSRPPIDLVASLWLAGSLIRVDLDGIDDTDAIAMINSVGFMESETRSVSELCTLAHGNPRLLERLLFGRSRTTGVESAIARADGRSREIIETVCLIEAVPYSVLVGFADPLTIDTLAETRLLSISRGRGGLVSILEPVTAETCPGQRSHRLAALISSLDSIPSSTVRRCPVAPCSATSGWSISLGRVPTRKQVFAAAASGNYDGRYLEDSRDHPHERLPRRRTRPRTRPLRMGCGPAAPGQRIHRTAHRRGRH